MKFYIVEYQFLGEEKIYSKKFEGIIQAMQFQSEILKKHKSKLKYCIYK